MIYKPPLLKGLNIRIPIIIPIEGRGFISQGSTVGAPLGLKGVRAVGFWGVGIIGF